MGWVTAVAGLYSAYKGSKSADKAADASGQGYQYLLNNPAVQGVQDQATYATDGINKALGLGSYATEGASNPMTSMDPRIQTLLDKGPRMGQRAFENYREGTGYNFRVGEGMGAITGSAAARGLLNSGSAAKALTSFGQNIASEEYGNFFNQQQSLYQNELSNRIGVDAAQKNNFNNYLTALQNQQSTGLGAAYNTASQGQSAGQAQAGYIMRGAEEISSGLGVATGGLSDWWGNGGKTWWQGLTS